MKRGDLSPIVGSLRYAQRDLFARWDVVHEVWRDTVAEQFHERHLLPFDPTVTAALKAIERLGLTMMRAYEACSPERD